MVKPVLAICCMTACLAARTKPIVKPGEGNPVVPAVITECVILKTEALDPSQITMIPALTYKLVFEAGEDIIPKVTDLENKQKQVCFPGTTLDIPTIVNDATYLNEYVEWKAENDAANAAAQAAQEEAFNEINTNPFCKGALDDVGGKVDAEVDLKEALVKLAKCMAAKSTLGK